MCHYLVVDYLPKAKKLTEAAQVINKFDELININQYQTSFDDHFIVIEDTPKNVNFLEIKFDINTF